LSVDTGLFCRSTGLFRSKTQGSFAEKRGVSAHFVEDEKRKQIALFVCFSCIRAYKSKQIALFVCFSCIRALFFELKSHIFLVKEITSELYPWSAFYKETPLSMRKLKSKNTSKPKRMDRGFFLWKKLDFLQKKNSGCGFVVENLRFCF